MGFEDREYYRDDATPRSGLPGFQFGSQSIVTSLVVINVVIFFVDSFTPRIDPDSDTHWLSYFMAIKTDHLWYVWTYLTHGFAHASLGSQTGIWHILGNMFTLWFFGRPLEHRFGRFEFLKFYLFAIVIAGLGWALIQLAVPNQGGSFIVGASGAVSAVLVVFIFMYPKETIYLMGIIPMPAWVFGVLLMVSNVSVAFTPSSHVAWEAHLIGALFGLAYYKLGWNFGRFQFGGLSKIFAGTSKLRVHNPESGDEKIQQQADEILAKISEQGESSLTNKERRILKKYSERVRKNRDFD